MYKQFEREFAEQFLEQLIKKVPSKWCGVYDYLSCNPNITWEIVKENPDKPWNYQNLLKNPKDLQDGNSI